MFTIDAPRLSEYLVALCFALEAEKENLSTLDAAIGDGDMGVSIANGFRAIRENLNSDTNDIGKVLQDAGLAFSDAAGATIGALVSLGLLRAARIVTGKTTIDLNDVASMVKAAEEGIRERGKAGLGDKTLLDALIPARIALEEALSQGLEPQQIATGVLQAAENGMKATIPMKATHGRSRWLGERTEGHQDPGATAIYLMVRALVGGEPRRVC